MITHDISFLEKQLPSINKDAYNVKVLINLMLEELRARP
jgi:hypothetical protein